MLGNLPGVKAYLDDVFVSEPASDRGRRQRAVLQCFWEHGVKLRQDKCSFRKSEVVYLGHRINAAGLQMTDKNLDAVVRAIEPTNVSERRSYLGFLSIIACFCRARLRY